MSNLSRLLSSLMLLTGLTAPACAADAPQPDAAALSPRQQVMFDRLGSLMSDRVRSSDLKMRILYSLNAGVSKDPVVDGPGFYLNEEIPASDLYEQARSSTDPVALDLLIHRCGYRTRTEAACDRVALAQRWTDADPQNAVAWLSLAGVLEERGRPEEADIAFHRAADAPHWHDHYNDVARLVAQTIPKDLPAPERSIALGEALSKGGFASPIAAFQTILKHCRGSNAPADCGHLVDTMVRDADTVLVLAIAARAASNAFLPAQRVADYQEKSDAAQWSSRLLRANDPEMAQGTDAGVTRAVALLQSLVDDGELKRVDRARVDARVSESEAARRYVATLSPDQLSSREKARSGS